MRAAAAVSPPRPLHRCVSPAGSSPKGVTFSLIMRLDRGRCSPSRQNAPWGAQVISNEAAVPGSVFIFLPY